MAAVQHWARLVFDCIITAKKNCSYFIHWPILCETSTAALCSFSDRAYIYVYYLKVKAGRSVFCTEISCNIKKYVCVCVCVSFVVIFILFALFVKVLRKKEKKKIISGNRERVINVLDGPIHSTSAPTPPHTHEVSNYTKGQHKAF